MKELYLHASSRAFGDGQHPSTQLAAQLLQQQSYTTPPHMLDIGCGSGILSFIAATLWQAHVTACDIQPLAIDTTRHNAQENMLSEYIHAVQADGLNHPHIIQRAPYNLVCINILLEPIVRYLAQLPSLLAQDANIICSGLLSWQVEPCLQHAKLLGYMLETQAHAGQWSAVCLHYPREQHRDEQHRE